jgi:hypothetical protein
MDDAMRRVRMVIVVKLKSSNQPRIAAVERRKGASAKVSG